MEISNDVARAEMLSFFKVRAEGKEIYTDEDYEKHLYKVIVQHLNIFADNNWGEFEYLTWMAAVEYYEIKHYLPRRLSQLRFELEQKHVGFFVSDNENDIKTTDRLQLIESLKARLPVNYKAIYSFSEYEFHVHKAIDERFGHFKAKDNRYNFDYWYDLVNLYELENNLPFRAGQLFCTERFVGFRSLRLKVSWCYV
jgi:hypothetical protein